MHFGDFRGLISGFFFYYLDGIIEKANYRDRESLFWLLGLEKWKGVMDYCRAIFTMMEQLCMVLGRQIEDFKNFSSP